MADNRIDILRAKVEAMISVGENLAADNSSLRSKVEDLQAVIDSKNSRINDLQLKIKTLEQKINNLQLVDALNISAKEGKDARRRVEKLITEIDKCIAMLGE